MKAIAAFAVIFSLIVVECMAHGHRSRRSRASRYQHNSRNRGQHAYHLPQRATDAPAPTASPTASPTTASVETTESSSTTSVSKYSRHIPPNTPRAAPDAQKSNEGFVVSLVDKFIPNKYDNKYNNNKYNNKHDDKEKYYKKEKKQYEKKHYNKYDKQSETCYEIITSDNSYSSKKNLSFQDISGTGTLITFASSPSSDSASVDITGTYYFFDEPLPTSIIVTTSGSVVLDPNSFGDKGADSTTPNLGNRDSTPYGVIAPFWSAFTVSSGFNTGAVYYEETDNQLIVQWNVNELNNESSFGGVFQVRFCEDGKDIVFAYQQLNCKTPATGAAEFGVKPYQPGFSKGQRSSFRISSCINEAYQFPRDNTGVWMKPTKCEYLIGQTGIRKPTEKKYNKHYSYNKHDDQGKYDKHEKCADIDDYFHNFMDSLFHKH